MIATFFVDTNILFYAEDPRDPEKRERARDVIRSAFQTNAGKLSRQVLREFFVSVTRKLGLPAEDARLRVELYARLDVVDSTTDDLFYAIDLHRLHGFSLWDALIVRAAEVSGCTRLYSEDLQHGRRINGVEIVNPFRG